MLEFLGSIPPFPTKNEGENPEPRVECKFCRGFNSDRTARDSTEPPATIICRASCCGVNVAQREMSGLALAAQQENPTIYVDGQQVFWLFRLLCFVHLLATSKPSL